MSKISTLINSAKGELIKIYYKLFPGDIPFGLNMSERRKHKVVVSLTSYGRRVREVSYLTLISLLKQSYKPDRIILWLGCDEWNKNNLPQNVQLLISKGVEVRFCKDMRSYTKLIPTLHLCPDDYIITVDDDHYYPNDFVNGLVSVMEKNPNFIYAYVVHKLTFDDNKVLKSYNDWELCTTDFKFGVFFPTGVGGIIYRSDLLHKDVTDEKLFMALAPKADDVWFFFMEVLKGTKCIPVKINTKPIPLDNFYQKLHAGSSLRDSNWGECLNDKQIKAVMDHYNLIDSDLYDFAKK